MTRRWVPVVKWDRDRGECVVIAEPSGRWPRVMIWIAVSRKRRSRRVRLGDPPVAAGLESAVFRWTTVDGPPDLELVWPEADSTSGDWRPVMVSDVEKLATDLGAQRAVKAFFDALPNLGRPEGAPNKVRAGLVDEVRADPSMSDADIDRRGVELLIWMDAHGDYDMTRKRVKRLRDDAASAQ